MPEEAKITQVYHKGLWFQLTCQSMGDGWYRLRCRNENSGQVLTVRYVSASDLCGFFNG